jgi:chloramphenicol-sensitive protein RarD
MPPTSQSPTVTGTLYALGAFTLWGLLPVYWKWLSAVPAGETLAHRVFWSAVCTTGLLLFIGRRNFFRLLASPRTRISLIVTGLLIGVNWFTYIYAVNTDRIVESSMGYYINPLISIMLGMVVLKERLNRLQIAALILAAVGVLIVTVNFGRVPWIALMLSSTFALYGLLKKLANLDSLSSLAIETLLLTPFALGFILVGMYRGTAAAGQMGLGTDMLLIFSGIVTALPLYWFAQGARRIPLSRVGFLQYIAPSLMLLIGVVLYKEPFTTVHAISFGCIWTALVLYSYSLAKFVRSRLNI